MKYRYKPGWGIEVRMPSDAIGRLGVEVTLRVPEVVDSRDGSIHSVVVHSTTWPPDMDEAEAVYQALLEWELHELDEFYRVDGEHYREPEHQFRFTKKR